MARLSRIQHTIQLLIAVFCGLFFGLIWSQHFHIMNNDKSIDNLSSRALYLSQSIDTVQRQVDSIMDVKKRAREESSLSLASSTVEVDTTAAKNAALADQLEHGNDNNNKTTTHEPLIHILRHQLNVQNEFQSLLRQQQFPSNCSHNRLLLTFRLDKPADGFARELQDMGRWLQVAMATKRCLVIQDGWKSAYHPPSCNLTTMTTTSIPESQRNTSWPCLWQPLSSCSSADTWTGPQVIDANIPASLALAEEDKVENTMYFDIAHYRSTRVIEARKWPWGRYAAIDVIPKWERAMGRFWIRAQLSHFLWNPSPWLQEQISNRIEDSQEISHLYHANNDNHMTATAAAAPALAATTIIPYIGMHIRFTDNRNALMREFGRDAKITRAFTNFMKHATQIQESNQNVSTIYISTDCDQIEAETKRRIYRKQWKFVMQRVVGPSSQSSSSNNNNNTSHKVIQRGSSTRHLWFQDGRSAAAAGIATDLELLRRADYLIGSHQSNVYRLACQLNTAYHVAKYPYDADRHLSVDIEWFEDP